MRLQPIFLLMFSCLVCGQELNNPNKLPLCSKDKQFHNCWGTETYVDGTQSAGEYRDGLMNGFGITNHADGDRYVGEFKNQKKHGRGIYTFKKAGRNRLEGIFENDKFIRAEKVDINALNGGEMKEFEPLYLKIFPKLPKCQSTAATSETIEKQKRSWNNCIGVYDSPDGWTLAVVYKNGIKHGEGLVVKKESGFQVIAKWDRDFMGLDDVEMIYSPSDKNVASYKGSINGEWHPHGNGIMIFKDGKKYIGQFSNGSAHGLGKKFDSNGKILFEGRFVNGWPETGGVSAGGGGSIFMEQLLKGGGSNCHVIRNECRQTSNYYACMDSFNRSQPSVNQSCQP